MDTDRITGQIKPKFQDAYMDIAFRFAELSYARRLKVGAVIVRDGRILSYGYNGTPEGWENCCEDVIYAEDDPDCPENLTDIAQMFPLTDQERLRAPVMEPDVHARYRLVTRPEVLHAESNAISKLAAGTESGEGASLFVTHQPCHDCAKLIYQSRIKDVFYVEPYRLKDGLTLLEKSGIRCTSLKDRRLLSE